ncbi:transporter [Alginatibacterium sediminis]|uniref:Transporter n=1 Tax=Alginatibacterium sediminis TaxID=2164068 RepID=A0A420ELI5_9ALTE|nr:efflux RND transporter permease subunit [Alginatibacterium sediminis]RKF21548.1 transporter [Alginatibacterium sediminis]
MKFTDIFIRRPVLALALSLLLVILGIQAIFKMQVREYPELTNTVVTISTAYYGAPSDVIQGFITQPLQQAIAEADNLDFLQSESRMGSSTITAYMEIGTDPDAALSEIMAKVNSVRARLPSEALDPNISRSTGSSTSIMYLAFASDELNSAQISDYLQRTVQPKLVTVTGVSKANVYGPNLSVRVWLDPLKMVAHKLTASQVAAALRQNNYRAAPGQAKSRFGLINVEADTDLKTVDEFKQMIVMRSDSGIVRLGDIAEIEMNAGRETIRAKVDGSSAVVIAIDPTPTANPLEVAKLIKEMYSEIDNNLPDNIDMQLLYDSTEYIESSINEVLTTIVEATIIVVITIFLFMGNLRAVIIPVIAIPLSLIGVCLAMQVLGFSINLLTLLAMVLAIGLVVDDAIVVVENVDRHIRMGKSPFDAAVIGTREIAVPVISMTITLIAVYSPIALLGGLTGALFKEFALTLAGAVFVSGFVALTLSPVMCAGILKKNENPGRFELAVHRFLDRLDDAYASTLAVTLKRRPAIVIFAIIVFASLYPLMQLIPSELAPAEDKGASILMVSAPPGSNLDYIDQYMDEVSRRTLEINDIEGTFTMAGIPSADSGLGIIRSVLWDQREHDQDTLMNMVKDTGKDIAGVSATSFPMPVLPGSSGGYPVQMVIKGIGDYRSILAMATELQNEATQAGYFVFSDLDLKYKTPQLSVEVDRDKAGAYGVKMEDIANTMSMLMGDGYINHINIDGRSYEVIPQVKRGDRLTPELIGNYYVNSVSGAPVPLVNLIDWKLNGEPSSLLQMDQSNTVTLNAVLMPGQAMGDALNFLEQKAADILPPGYTFDYKGESRQFVQEGSALYVTFALALAIIFLVLAAQFESWRDPLVIMVSVPLAICGALLLMGWGLASMNIYTQIGMITLVGLITKHGILMCEVAKEQQMEFGKSKVEAIQYAARIRLRAILMTTISMVAGLIPLLLAVGPGAAARFDIGMVICAGLSIGTIFTLFVLPTIYTLLGANHKALPEVEHL